MRLIHRLCLALAWLAFPFASSAETFLIQAGEDSSPYAFLPDLERGARNSAYAFTNDLDGQDHSFEYYIRFDLPPELTAPGTVVDEAYAWVYYGFDYTLFGDTTDEVGEILCHEVLTSWSQLTLTWNNRPPIGPVFDGWENVTERGMYWCDVRDLVQQWIDGAPNRGIALTSRERRVIGFHTFDDGSVGPNFRPSLYVETLPESTTTAGWTIGAAALVLLQRRRARSERARNLPSNERKST